MCKHWDSRFMGIAKEVATWSKDPSTKVGCVIVNQYGQVVSTGYNGLPRGVDDDPSRYANREVKYRMVVHAELNAILQAGGDIRGGTAYVTHPPCSQCAACLIQAGIVRVVTNKPDDGMKERFKESFESADIMFAEAGVKKDVC